MVRKMSGALPFLESLIHRPFKFSMSDDWGSNIKLKQDVHYRHSWSSYLLQVELFPIDAQAAFASCRPFVSVLTR